MIGASEARFSAGAPGETSPSVELALVGLAVAIAVTGIVVAVRRLDPAKLVPKAQALPEHGIERVLANKYYVDEVYDAAVVKPTLAVSRGFLWRGVDAGLIDGLLVNGSAWAARTVGWMGSQLQTGRLGAYAWVLVIGVLLVLRALRRAVVP